MSDNTPTPPRLRTNAEFRTAIHDAVRRGLEATSMRTVAREDVRAIADQVLTAIDGPAEPENASSAPRSPHTGFDGARLAGVSVDRDGLGSITVEMTLDNVDPEAFALMIGQPLVDIDALEALATAASPGRWEVNEGDDEITLDKGTALTRWNEEGSVGYPARTWHTVDRLAEFDADLPDDDLETLTADLQYIAAARPEVMLALIERLRRAEARVDEAARQGVESERERVLALVAEAALHQGVDLEALRAQIADGVTL